MNLNNKRRDFLECARRIVIRDGVARLTLDAVAAEAGVSKGGILYHFPTKNALIGDMIRAMFDEFAEAQQHFIAEDPLLPGRWTRAYVRASIDETTISPESGAALLAAVGNDPLLMQSIQEHYAEYQKRLDADGLDPITALMIRLTMDGLFLSQLLGLAPPDRGTAERLVSRLLEITTSIQESTETQQENIYKPT